MNYRMISFLMGHIMRLEAIFMMPPLAISLYGNEHSASFGFFVTIAVLIVVSLICIKFKPANKTYYAREGFVTVALAWIAVSLFGALPFYISGEIPGLVDSVFETVSGFTTTGASILTDVESLPKGLLYWRSFTHWLGGMGVLVFLLAIVPMTKGSGNSMFLLRAESPGPQVDKLVPKISETAKILYKIYIVLTLVQIVFLLAGGMPLFDSVTIAFGTAGTGGFAIKNDSIAGYSPYLQMVVTVFMVIFGINFNIFYLLLIREFSKAFHDEELRAYLGIMFGSILLITINILPLYDSHLWGAFRHATFQVSSVMTTTGFATADFNQWPELSRTILVVLMILGASAGSTGGGIKTSRVLILFKTAKRAVRKLLCPHSVKVVKLNGNVLDEGVINGVYIYMTVYSMISVLSLLLISVDNYSFETNLTAVMACLNNIGPGLGLVGPMGNFSIYSDFSKLVLTGNMLIGRLEIFPMLLLFFPSVWKR